MHLLTHDAASTYRRRVLGECTACELRTAECNYRASVVLLGGGEGANMPLSQSVSQSVRKSVTQSIEISQSLDQSVSQRLPSNPSLPYISDSDLSTILYTLPEGMALARL